MEISSQKTGSGLELTAITRYEIDHAALNMDPARVLGKISSFYSHLAPDQELIYMMLEHQEYLWPILDKHIKQAIKLEDRIFRVTPEADASMLSSAIKGYIGPRPLSIVHDIYELSMDREFCNYFSDNTYIACIIDVEDEIRYNSDARDERRVILDFGEYTGMAVPAFVKAYRFDLPGMRQYIVSVRTSVRDSDYHRGIITVIPEPTSPEEAVVQASLLAKMSRQLSPQYLEELAESLEQLGSKMLPEALRAGYKLTETVLAMEHDSGQLRLYEDKRRGDSIHIYADKYGMVLQASAMSDSRPFNAELYVRLDRESVYYMKIV